MRLISFDEAEISDLKSAETCSEAIAKTLRAANLLAAWIEPSSCGLRHLT